MPNLLNIASNNSEQTTLNAFNIVELKQNNIQWDLTEYFSPYFQAITAILTENYSC